jgi:hypothetical protein
LERGYVAEWRGKFTSIGGGNFFGVGGSTEQSSVYCGVGGMTRIASEILGGTPALSFRSGVRVGSVEKGCSGGWQLRGVSGSKAFHDTKDNKASVDDRASADLGTYDIVVITDASAAMGSWHRASAGLPAEFVEGVANRIKQRVRVALFTALVVFQEPVQTNSCGIAIGGGSPVWFASRTASKPGLFP